jgi:adenylylsulfate kinase
VSEVAGGARLIWITGISGAGKTTIGKALYERLKPVMPALVYLDGDEVRRCFGDDLGFTLEARDANAFRFTRLCRLLCAQGISVVCAANLTSQRFRDWCRAEIPGYFEVFLDVPMEVLTARDPKGLYARALAGETSNVVGIDIPFVPPLTPDLVIDNSRSCESFDSVCEQIMRAADVPRLASGEIAE